MTGVMEQVLGELQSMNATLRSIASMGSAPAGTAAALPAATQTLTHDPLSAGAGLTAAAKPAHTEDSVMALIEPHLDNMTIKTALQAVLSAMGIPRLPEARPDQYDELYSRFTAVIQQHSPHTLNSGAGAAASII